MTDSPQGEDLYNYTAWWEWAADNLNLLLEPREDVRLPVDKQISIARLLQEANRSYQSGSEEGVVYLAHIFNLVEDLDYLRTREPNAFASFKASLTSRSQRDYAYLTGMWFEVRVAQLLSRAGLPFTQPDPPDFSVDVNGEVVSIECYSPRAVEGDALQRRTYNAVKKKERKYRGQIWTKGLTVLALDATWLVRAQGQEAVQGEEALSEEFIAGLQQAASPTRFDLVIAFWFGHAIEKQKDKKATSCVYIPSDVAIPAVVELHQRLLAGFGPEDEERIRLQKLPENQ